MALGSNSNLALFFLLILSSACFCTGRRAISCNEIEKQALLGFKQTNNVLTLPSWNATTDHGANCCRWVGVVCSNSTGRVHELHLRARLGELGSVFGVNLSHFQNLKHLTYLDLSSNYFGGSMPDVIGSFSNLQYLDLTDNGFYGTVPSSIGNLSNLLTLSLRESYPTLIADSLDWLSSLSRLEILDMSYVNLDTTENWEKVMNTLPHLIELRLKHCKLHSIGRLDRANLSSLAILDLSNNMFGDNSVPSWIFQLKELDFLDLSMSEFEGPLPNTSCATKIRRINLSYNHINAGIPDWFYSCNQLEFVLMSHNTLQGTVSSSIANLTSLRLLDFSSNHLSGEIPAEFAGLMCHTQFLDLSKNMLEGGISNIIGSMLDCSAGATKFLYLAENQLSGELPDQIGAFTSLRTLDVGKNALSGSLPWSLGKLSSLKNLILPYNKLVGALPVSFGQLLQLELVTLTGNMLEGVVNESHFANLSNLSAFLASGNHLTLRVSKTWIPPFKLDVLKLGSWNIGRDIPAWLETQRETITQIDLSNTGLVSGSIPSWLWSMYSLNLSNNQLSGRIPDLEGKFPCFTFLSSNRFHGPLPRLGNGVLVMDLSNNSFSGGISHFLCNIGDLPDVKLTMLDLGGNHLSGTIPDCFMKREALQYLNLGNNKLTGRIPSSIGSLRDLLSLNLYNNRLSGQIPQALTNCTRLRKIDLSNNRLVRNVPEWVGTTLSGLKFLILHSNKLSGEIHPRICCLNSLQILDISYNRFSGKIPSCINNFTSMITKCSLIENGQRSLEFKFSSAVFFESAFVSTKGIQLHYDTTLSLVTNINLSKNNFSGEIPEQLASLVELRSLNLSRNRLTGSIPDALGSMRQLESLDLSMNSLSGEIPQSFSELSYLSYMNLSHNNLTGSVPKGTQIQNLNASSFLGNHLCGPPTKTECGGDHLDTIIQENEVDLFDIFLISGYGVGFSAVCTALILKRKWRDSYFEFVLRIWNKLYVTMVKLFSK